MAKVFACTDLYGFKDKYDAINNYITNSDTVYFLGNAADYGQDGWEIIKDLKENPNWIWIIGKQDKILSDYILNQDDWQLELDLKYSTSSSTYNSIQEDKEKFGNDYILDIGNYISQLPQSIVYINKSNQSIYLSHTGFLNANINNLDQYLNNYLIPVHDLDPSIDLIMHGDISIQDLYTEFELAKRLQNKDLIIPDYSVSSAYWYLNNTKCDLNTYVPTSDNIILIDLDTFEEKIF